ncbi:helix-hairpin-helix domain-containing protein [Kiritimatiellota bacterium B12222]|nr:helix-hairpin-helix domain-containing protein [Kiritimatiellota bacterium B12222]
MRLSPLLLYLLLLLPLLRASELHTITDVRLVPTDWADGDSFRVRFPDGNEHTLRLYGADCFEWHLTDDYDVRRLRTQRRYFGISSFGTSPSESIHLAKSIGEAAALQTRAWLSQPFTVHTTFADGRGSPHYKRIYAFVTTSDGQDLATLLVENGLARAYGVVRSTPTGESHENYREQLKDAELIAARKSKGAWAYTDWDRLPQERQQQRQEEEENKIALGTQIATQSVNPNTASRDELMRIPNIGEVTALAIVEGRPYTSLNDLNRVHGIGPKTIAKISPWLNWE